MTIVPWHLFIVFIGGGIGSCLRYLTNLWTLSLAGAHYPLGTFAVNVVGGLVMGLVAGFLLTRPGLGGAQEVRLFLMTGILGGYTTFSAFSLDTVVLWQRGEFGLMAIYVLSSVVLSILAVALGIGIMKTALSG